MKVSPYKSPSISIYLLVSPSIVLNSSTISLRSRSIIFDIVLSFSMSTRSVSRMSTNKSFYLINLVLLFLICVLPLNTF